MKNIYSSSKNIFAGFEISVARSTPFTVDFSSPGTFN